MENGKLYKRIGGNVNGETFCSFCSTKNDGIHHIACELERCPRGRGHEYFYSHDGSRSILQSNCSCRKEFYLKSPKDKRGVFAYFDHPIKCEICNVRKHPSSFQINLELSADLLQWLKQFCLYWNNYKLEDNCKGEEYGHKFDYRVDMLEKGKKITDIILGDTISPQESKIIEFTHYTLWWLPVKANPAYDKGSEPQMVGRLLNRLEKIFENWKPMCDDCSSS